jgi:serine/threonine protein kinase/tetratricopeptide (TPR) repeat protein
MGLVYKAEDTRLARAVALKFVADDLSADPNVLERFRREAQSASALNHPNICTIYDIGESEGRPFIAMEFLQGQTLKDRLDDGPLKDDALLEASIQLASALGAAHAAGILHRDIKPANIFVTTQGQLKILDFGLAKLMFDKKDASGLSQQTTVMDSRDLRTRPGSAIGTFLYMSPEQARGEELDARSDLFSLGAVLYEMATGRPAFTGNTTAVIFDAILNRNPIPPAQVNPYVPHQLEEIICKLLEKDREQRYQTASELEAELRRMWRDGASGAASISSKPNRNRSRVTIAIGAALAVAALIVAALWFGSSRRPVLTDRDVIVMADFKNETGDSVFDETLKQALAIQLEQSRYINVLPEDRVRETLQRMARSPDEKVTDSVAREICEREGLKAALGGSIVGLGTHYVLTLNATNCGSGESLAREQREAGSKEQVLATLADAASNLRNKLGESLPSIQKTDVPFENKVTTTSLEALKAYTEGMKLNSQAKFREAVLFLEKAVALDPNFVAAYSSLRVVNSNLGDDANARKYATKAFELRDRTSERERLRVTAAYQVTVLRNLEKAAETYGLYARMYPTDYISWNGLATAHINLGRLDDALSEFQTVARLRPMPLNLANLGAALLSTGQVEESRAVLQKAVEEKRDIAGTHSLLYEIAFIKGDAPAMQQELDWLKIPPSGRPPQGDLLFFGRMKESRKRDASAGVRWELLFGYGKPAEVRASEVFRQNRSGIDEAITAAMAGEIEGIRALEELSKEFPEDTFLNSIHLPTAKAAFELHAGHAQEAIQLLKPVGQYEPSARSLLAVYLRGKAYLQTKSGTEAAAEFQKILSHRTVAIRSTLFPLSYLGVARAYSFAGDRVNARKSYDEFFAIWKDADTDIPVLVEARAEYKTLVNQGNVP